MKRLILLLSVLVHGYAGLSQESETIKDHSFYLNTLANAKDSLYSEVLSKYNRYMLLHPYDFKVRIERCKFIQNAYYDSYEDYNPNAEEAETCAQALLRSFPKEPGVRLYMTEFLYGDSAIAYLETLVTAIEENPDRWKDHDWIVYKDLAENYEYNEDYEPVVKYGQLAEKENDTLDLSLQLGRAYKNLNHTSEAIDVLVSNLDSTNVSWQLNQKGRLLLELGVPEKALEALKMAAKGQAQTEDFESLAEAMIDNGLIAEARQYLLQNYKETTWNATASLQKLLEYDLQYGSVDSASFTYQRFSDVNFWNDPFGIYRLQLFAKGPGLGWRMIDIGRVLLLVTAIFGLLVIPYLWVLPIHYFGTIQKAKGKIFTESPFHWGLKHFWLVCSLWLITDFLVGLLLDYPGFVSNFNDAIVSDGMEPVSLMSANQILIFCTLCAAFTIPFLSWNDVNEFFGKVNVKQIMSGVGLALLLRFGLALYYPLLIDFGLSDNSSGVVASVVDNIVSVNQYYNPYLGFFFVVLLVPFYEEVLFRGIFLSACQRNMKFALANSLQSLVFALVHNDLKLIPFYFAFGMIAGFFRQKTQSLTIGTSMHMTNNLIAFVFLLVTRS